jgi:hypothetical protein
MLPGWTPLTKFAKAQGVREQTMRRRLLVLNREHGGIVRTFSTKGKPRKYWVRVDRLKKMLDRVPEDQEFDLAALFERVRILENRVEALKKTHKQLKEQANRGM